MRIEFFEIQNFKGIRQAKLEFSTHGTARVYTLVGLNESGKTTVLEALHWFAPDDDVRVVVGGPNKSDQDGKANVPRSQISDFDGKISVTAQLTVEEGDRQKLAAALTEDGLQLEQDSIPDRFYFERYVKFVRGDFRGNFFSTDAEPKVRTGKKGKYRAILESELPKFDKALKRVLPVIAYFPTFVFDFPEKIYLTRWIDTKNHFYRLLFQDILDHVGRGHRIPEHITHRVRKTEYKIDWSSFFPVFQKSTEKDQIDQVVDLAAQAVTRVVFKRWNEIFGEVTGRREIIIDWGVEQGLPKRLANGTETE